MPVDNLWITSGPAGNVSRILDILYERCPWLAHPVAGSLLGLAIGYAAALALVLCIKWLVVG
jgi:hypothetical protein